MTYLYLDKRYLDVPEQINRDFVKQLLIGEKKAFRQSEVKYIDMPFYPELSVKNLIDMFKDDKEVSIYVRDKFWEGKPPTRGFIFNIVNTVYPGYCEQLVMKQTHARCSVLADGNQGDSIKLTPE